MTSGFPATSALPTRAWADAAAERFGGVRRRLAHFRVPRL